LVVSAVLGWRSERLTVQVETDVDAADSGRSPIERAVVALVSSELFPIEREFLERNTFRLRYRDFDWRLNDLTGGRPN
jgi:hypothetical protein